MIEFQGTISGGVNGTGRVAVSAANPLPVTGTFTGTVTANADAKANAADQTLVEGSENPLSTDLAGYLRVTGKFSTAERTEISGSAASAAVLSGFPISDTSGYRSIIVQTTAIAANSTLVVEESNDGTTWTNLTSVGGTASITTTGTSGYNFSAKQVRVRQSVYGGSGTSSVVAELRAAAIQVPAAFGAGVTDTRTQRMVHATDDLLVLGLGGVADAAWASGSGSVIGVLKGLFGQLAGTLAANISKIGGSTVAATGANVLAGTLPVQDADGYSPGASTVTSATTVFSVDTQGFELVAFQTTALGSGCTFVFEGCNDNTNWVGVTGSFISNTGVNAAISTFSSVFASSAFLIPASLRYIRVRCSVYGSGNVTMHPVLRKNPGSITVNTSSTLIGVGASGVAPPPTDVALRASATASATYTSADQTNSSGARGLSVVLDITAAGTGSLTLAINYKDGTSGKYIALLAGAAEVGTGTKRYVVYPGGGTVTANAAANDHIGRVFQVVVTYAGTGSWTFSVGYTLLS